MCTAQNKQLSDSIDPIFKLQGINWLLRRIISLSTVTLHAKQFTDDAGLEHVDMSLTTTGGMSGATELRPTDWEFRDHKDPDFGHVKNKSRWIQVQEIADEFLAEGWIQGEGDNDERRVLETLGESCERAWIAHQIWGFGIVQGERRHVRKVVVRRNEELASVRLVYDWLGRK